MFAVAEVHVNYRKPARLDDELRITCVPVPEGRASIRFTADRSARGDVLLAEGEVRVACVDAKTFRPRPLPDFIMVNMPEGKRWTMNSRSSGWCCRRARSCRCVMGLLLLASLFSWTIIFRKRALLSRAHDEAENFENSFWKGGDLTALYRQIESRGGATGMSSIFEFGFREFARLKQGGIPPEQLLEGARRAMRVGQLKELERLEESLANLATIGSTSPVRGPVRHGVGHHEFLRRAGRRAAGDARRWSRPASPRR